MSNASRKLMQVQATAAPVDTGDPYWKYVSLLLDGDGTSGDDNETFTDSSTNGFTVTESGSVVQGSFSPYGNNWSVYFDGSSYLDTASGATALGTGAFTVEFWINTTDTSFNIMNPDSSTGNGFWGLMVQSGDLRWNNQYNLTNLWVVDGAPILDGQWHHVAIVSNSSVFKVFYDGVSQSIQSGSFNDSYNYPYNDGLRIGSGNLATFKGYLSNIRLVSGTAIYSSDFNVPTEPFTNSASYTEKLLACQSNRFIDNGDSSYSITTSGNPKVTPFSPFKDSNARTLTADGGSGYFEGSGDYLSVGGVTTEFDFGTGDLTIEGWVNLNATGQFNPIVLFGRDTHSGITCDISSSNNPRIIAHIGGSWGVVATGSTSLTKDQWYHLAFVRNGSSFKIYVNGAQDASATNSGSITAPSSDASAVEQIGYLRTNGGADRYFNGYISSLRVVKGTAVYTSAFTPPTAPLTAVTNTELLTNFHDAGVFDRAGINNLNTAGNAQIDTAVKKYGTGSIQFDGTGDYLATTNKSFSELGFGSGDFTVEGWFYIQVGDQYPYALDFRTSGTQTAAALYFYNYGNGSIDWYVNGSSRILGTSAGNNVWQHIAVCREGTSTRMFVNGTQSGSTYTDSTNYVAYSGNIGRSHNGVRVFQGFIDDFRITKGYARYTSNFTAPTAALPKF